MKLLHPQSVEVIIFPSSPTFPISFVSPDAKRFSAEANVLYRIDSISTLDQLGCLSLSQNNSGN